MGCQKERDIIDPINGKVYKYLSAKDRWDRNDFDQTQNLLDWVGQTTGAIVTGYFVCGKNDMTNLLMVIGHETYKDYNYDKQNAMWKEDRNNGVVIETKGYNKLFLTAASNLGAGGDDTLDDDLIGAKKSTLTARFKKNQKSKTTSRFLTNEFIKEIA